MSESAKQCPRCGGTGRVLRQNFTGPGQHEISCRVCKGTGVMPMDDSSPYRGIEPEDFGKTVIERARVRFETHQRRIRDAIKRLNDVVEKAAEDNVYCVGEIIGTENNDHCICGLRIMEWEVDEPKRGTPSAGEAEGGE